MEPDFEVGLDDDSTTDRFAAGSSDTSPSAWGIQKKSEHTLATAIRAKRSPDGPP